MNTKNCNINSESEKIHTLDQYTRRQQTETTLSFEDECITLAIETDVGKKLSE